MMCFLVLKSYKEGREVEVGSGEKEVSFNEIKFYVEGMKGVKRFKEE